MLRIENLKLPPGSGDAALRAQVLKVLRLPEERLLALRILRRSIDAREGVHWVYTVEAETANEDAVLRRCRDKRVSRAEPRPAYRLPQAVPTPDCPRSLWEPDPRDCSPRWYWPGPVPVPFYWNVAAGWRNAPPM